MKWYNLGGGTAETIVTRKKARGQWRSSVEAKKLLGEMATKSGSHGRAIWRNHHISHSISKIITPNAKMK